MKLVRLPYLAISHVFDHGDRLPEVDLAELIEDLGTQKVLVVIRVDLLLLLHDVSDSIVG